MLAQEAVRDIAAVALQLLGNIQIDMTSPTGQAGRRKKKPTPVMEEEDEDNMGDEEDTIEYSPQTARFALVDVLCALMRSCRDDFSEVALSPLMEFVKVKISAQNHEFDRSLAFYIAGVSVECVGERSVNYWNWFLNEALQGVMDKSAVVRQYATMTVGNAAEHPGFAPMAAAAASQIYNVLQKQGERHRRRRAAKAADQQASLAVDACIRAMGQIAEFQEQQLGPHAANAWSIWLGTLPLKYDEEAGQKAHAQFLGLVARSHPALTAPENQAKALSILVGVWKTKFSNKELDVMIAAAVAAIGEATLAGLGKDFPETKQRKLEKILKASKSV